MHLVTPRVNCMLTAPHINKYLHWKPHLNMVLNYWQKKYLRYSKNSYITRKHFSATIIWYASQRCGNIKSRILSVQGRQTSAEVTVCEQLISKNHIFRRILVSGTVIWSYQSRLCQCWPTSYDAVPGLSQHWLNRVSAGLYWQKIYLFWLQFYMAHCLI